MKSIVQSFYNWYSGTLRNSKYRWLIVLGTALYLISPIDISPDFLPIIGWLDDGILLTLLTTELSQMLIEYRRGRKGEVIKDIPNETVSVSEPKVVDVEASVK